MAFSWQAILQEGNVNATPVMALAKICQSCDYIGHEQVEQCANLIFEERGVPIGTLGFGPQREDAAMVRLVLDEKQLRNMSLGQHPVAFLERLATESVEYLGSHTVDQHTPLSFQDAVPPSYDITYRPGKAAIIYFDFLGPEAQSDATEFYTIIQSALEQREQGSCAR